jgi:hypothetical protein
MLFDSDYIRAARLLVERRGLHAEAAARTQVRELRRSSHFIAADIWERLVLEIQKLQAEQHQPIFSYDPADLGPERPTSEWRIVTA